MSVDQNSFINENSPQSIAHYLTAGRHRDLYLEWLRGIRDVRAKVAVIRRVGQLERGLFGDHKFCRDGVWELRVDVGQGYRIYYARPGSMVLLLGGGTKRSQAADIERAVTAWTDWQRRTDDEKQTP